MGLLHRSSRLFHTAMSGDKIYEGILAVHKPPGVSSADVLRHLQKHFNPSQTFRGWVQGERNRREQDHNLKQRHKQKRVDVKIGHGGTLDPLATGVLITGIGKGTKHLQGFLGCTKTYETVVLFGAETDTYDRVGRIVRRAPYEHITREVVDKALEQFRGKIMQRPPIFSALRVEGKRLYEYAREGKEPPIEIKARPVEVHDLRIVEWYEPGTHEYKWPEEEMVGDEKRAAEKLLEKDASVPVASAAEDEISQDSSLKRKPSPSPTSIEKAEEEEDLVAAPASKRPRTTGEGETTQAETQESTTQVVGEKEQTTEEAPAASSSSSASSNEKSAPLPPAVKIIMTVSSGFYVRSLAHDLGKAVGSCGLMSSLVRSRQGDYVLAPDQVLEYKDLEEGEDVWGPKVRQFLENWQKKHGDSS